MGKLSSWLWGAAMGAGVMYFMDPQNGNRRKAMVRDRVYRMRSQADDALDVGINDLRNRVRGVLADGMAIVSNEDVPDQVIEQRIRSRLGFLSRHPGAVSVTVQDGRAVLTGDILHDEMDALVKGAGRIRGVREVANELKAHPDAGNIQQLQGEGWMPGQDGLAQWSPSTRLLTGIGAGYLLLYGMARGGFIGTLSRLSGIALGTRALTNMNFGRMTGMTPQGNAIQVRKTIMINAPVDDVYRLWSNFENFPRFMNNIQSIRTMGGERSHWVVKGPAGSKVEFDAITTDNIPNELVAWVTTPDSQVKTQGQVSFRENGRDRTQVNVNMSYTPPAGIAGHAVAALFGKDPKSEMDADLARMKSLLEQGKTTSERKRVTRDEVMPVTGQSGMKDAGSEDAGSEDAGSQDAGNKDAGSMDDSGSTSGQQSSGRKRNRNRNRDLESGMGSSTGMDDRDADDTMTFDNDDMGGADPIVPPEL